MVQRFPELKRVDQGPACSIIPVQPVYVLSGDQKRCDPLAVFPDPDATQFTATAQKIRSSKNVRGFKMDGFQWAHLLPAAA
jgi:hypothetical protein